MCTFHNNRPDTRKMSPMATSFEFTAIMLYISAVVCTTPSSQLKIRGHESVIMYSSPASFSGQIQSERLADYGYLYLPTVNR